MEKHHVRPFSTAMSNYRRDFDSLITVIYLIGEDIPHPFPIFLRKPNIQLKPTRERYCIPYIPIIYIHVRIYIHMYVYCNIIRCVYIYTHVYTPLCFSPGIKHMKTILAKEGSSLLERTSRTQKDPWLIGYCLNPQSYCRTLR